MAGGGSERDEGSDYCPIQHVSKVDLYHLDEMLYRHNNKLLKKLQTAGGLLLMDDDLKVEVNNLP